MNASDAIGAVRTYRGQTYAVTGQFVRKRKDGTEATILELTSPCAQCGEPFVVTVPLRAARWQPNRRCKRHKRPGLRVKAEENRPADCTPGRLTEAGRDSISPGGGRCA